MKNLQFVCQIQNSWWRKIRLTLIAERFANLLRSFSVSARDPLLRPDGSRALQIFVLEIDRRPTLALRARDLEEAQEICRDVDLRADLTALTSNGAAICSPQSS